MRLIDWTVDYGQGPVPCEVPHAWRQDVDVRWEGPAIYRRKVTLPADCVALRFHGVSYAASVYVNDQLLTQHEGIWDAFDVPVADFANQVVNIRVAVTKNGGPTYPVKDVASGFLPFVFHTFGGVFRDVEVITATSVPLERDPASVVRERGYVRGALTWGWYAELGHPNPPIELIRKEIKAAKELGFNLIKFCLWIPSHAYLEELDKAGMTAWLELPLWDPTPDPDHQVRIADEMERIVRQYAHHPNIVLWTIGCELSNSTPPEYRSILVQMVKELVPGLVKDNSGGAEMYGGDPQEFGDFYDFHPYCDLPFYPQVIESLLPGPRTSLPIFLGEFNDIDVHRDTARTVRDNPYWISADPALNDQGVRWQYDFPTVLPNNRFTRLENEDSHQKLMISTKRKAEFIRKYVQEAVRSHSEISGYVITGWADTPISTAGFVDEYGEMRFNPSDVRKWNGPDCLFIIPSRRPPWINGGNRAGWVDPFNYSTGPVLLKIGVHSERGLHGLLVWDIIRFSWDGGSRGRVANGSSEQRDTSALNAELVGEIYWPATEPGGYLLRVTFAGVSNSWPIWVTAPWDPSELDDLAVYDPERWFGGSKSGDGTQVETRWNNQAQGIVFCLDEGTLPMPFWREAGYEFGKDFWRSTGMSEAWERLLPISPDRSLDPSFLDKLGGGFETHLTRIDMRTYVETPVLVQRDGLILTTLRPFGGLGNQPIGLKNNPAGAHLFRCLLNHLV